MNERDQPHVLVVDDQAEMASLVADALVDEGYVAFAACSGGEALDVLKTERIDAVVTDLTMPKVSGLDVLRASQRLDPSRPVILMTDFGALDSALQAFEVGAYHYLLKPFRMDTLANVLRKALARS
jgi:two-component system, NtrC family, response regulator HydG